MMYESQRKVKVRGRYAKTVNTKFSPSGSLWASHEQGNLEKAKSTLMYDLADCFFGFNNSNCPLSFH